jgi:hypothetical protein
MSENHSSSEQDRPWRYPDVFERPSVLTSYETDWSHIGFHCQNQTAGESPTLCVDQYMIGIITQMPCQLEHVLNGRFQTKMSFNGAVMLCPMQHTHSFRWHGELHAIGLHVTPSLLT